MQTCMRRADRRRFKRRNKRAPWSEKNTYIIYLLNQWWVVACFLLRRTNPWTEISRSFTQYFISYNYLINKTSHLCSNNVSSSLPSIYYWRAIHMFYWNRVTVVLVYNIKKTVLTHNYHYSLFETMHIMCWLSLFD